MRINELANHIWLRILSILEDRSGFDHWWDELDDDIKGELGDCMIEIIGGVLRKEVGKLPVNYP